MSFSKVRPLKLIFCHIPKSGGTTMGQILERNFGPAFYPYYGLWDRYMFSAEDVEGMCGMHPHFTCMASHLFSLSLPYQSDRFDFRALSFVRDPVDRALSLYFYNFRLARENPGFEPPQDIESFFAPILDTQSDGRFFDAQWQFLTHGLKSTFSMSDLEGLMMERKVLLAPVDCFDDACLLLEKRFPESIRNAAYGKSRNQSSRNANVPPQLLARLQEVNQRDRELHEKVSSLFARLVAEEIGGEEELKNARSLFAQRCKRQAVLDRIRQTFDITLKKLLRRK